MVNAAAAGLVLECGQLLVPCMMQRHTTRMEHEKQAQAEQRCLRHAPGVHACMRDVLLAC